MRCSFKLQFYVEPEDRVYPNYPRTPTPAGSTETVSNTESRLLVADEHIPSDEPTQSTDPSFSSVATTPELPDRPSTPTATEPADSRPTTPTQELGDGFTVVPGPSRRLQRERPFSVAPDPMWNSSREINPFERLAAPAPPPPYVPPPTYDEAVPIEIEIEPETLQAPTLTVQHVSVSSSVIPPAPAEEEEVEASSNAVANTSTSTSTSNTDDSPNNAPPSPVVSSLPSATAGHLDNDAGLSSLSLIPSTGPVEDSLVSGVEADHDDPDLSPSPQLSEKARGKKRMREEDYTSDEENQALESLLGEGCSSGSGHNPGSSGRDQEPDRKRMKMDTRISTDQLVVDRDVLMAARMGLVEELTPRERRRQVEKLKAIEKLFRSGRGSLRLR
jgi:hypothetical protein